MSEESHLPGPSGDVLPGPAPTDGVDRVEVARWSAAQAAAALPPYEIFYPADRVTPESPAVVEEIMATGWKLGRLARIRFGPDMPWEELCVSDRSWNFHLQS
jgi:hypothetical protein